MRRRFIQVAAWSALLVFAGLSAAQGKEPSNSGPYDTLGPWKIANTLLFAIGFGYFIYRSAPKFFNTRSADIQKSIQDATGLKMEADLRYSDIDRRMATLSDEVKTLRERSVLEMEREHGRRVQETEEGIHRIQANVNAEIEAFRLGGVQMLQRQTASAALDLAAQRLGERTDEADSSELLQDFVHLVEKGKN